MSALTKAPEALDSNIASLSQSENRGILIAALVCGGFSLLVSIITLRWFILMRRTFRHRLVLMLIASDLIKAAWLFIFPMVNVTQGIVRSESAFCQSSGFLLALSVEASDIAILIIALHSMLYIFRPPTQGGEGGLYRWRKYVYTGWLILPLVFASLAFVNPEYGYTTAGTFCYLPKRPFWYRIALAWGPRYLIILIIFGMFIAVYVYVSVKFKTFANLGRSDSLTDSESFSRRSSVNHLDMAVEQTGLENTAGRTMFTRPTFLRTNSGRHEAREPERPKDPWDDVSFITSKPLRTSRRLEADITPTSYIPRHNPSDTSDVTQVIEFPQTVFSAPNSGSNSRKPSACPTIDSTYTADTGTTAGDAHEREPKQGHRLSRRSIHQQSKPTDPLELTRSAIRKQLRYMFVYPLVYVLMWMIPFVSHCMLYSDWYSQHPVYWLQVTAGACVALQAAADCIVFSWREKPWRRITQDNKYSITYWRQSFSLRHESKARRSNMSSVVAPDQSQKESTRLFSGTNAGRSNAMWWEAEGKRRNDSIWLGTDQNSLRLSPVQETHSNEPIPCVIVEEQVEDQHHAGTSRSTTATIEAVGQPLSAPSDRQGHD